MAITEMQLPTNNKGLKRLLKMINYLAKFIHNASSVIQSWRNFF